jgi:hypothetical protein
MIDKTNVLHLRMPKIRGYVTPEISDLNPPEVIAACRLMTLLRYMEELPELARYHDAILHEFVKQGLGKRKLRGGFRLSFQELVKSLKQENLK